MVTVDVLWGDDKPVDNPNASHGKCHCHSTIVDRLASVSAQLHLYISLCVNILKKNVGKTNEFFESD